MVFAVSCRFALSEKVPEIGRDDCWIYVFQSSLGARKKIIEMKDIDTDFATTRPKRPKGRFGEKRVLVFFGNIVLIPGLIYVIHPKT